jgi:hypothetical protein
MERWDDKCVPTLHFAFRKYKIYELVNRSQMVCKFGKSSIGAIYFC